MKEQNPMKTYETPLLRFLPVETEAMIAFSMTNGFIYNADENEEYWYF